MCGIAGLTTLRDSGFEKDTRNSHGFDSRETLEPLITGMLSRIDHRGPDESGIYFDHHAAVGTVRLAIIDVESGQQPMTALDRYVISFNGAIYNFVELRKELQQLGIHFESNCDTEVVLQSLLKWGTDALHRFDGHFAISLYDRQTKELLLARDPFGEKPLFFTTTSQHFAFASEIKAFQALPGFQFRIDEKALQQIAWAWTTLPNQTCFENVSALRPGHWMKVRHGKTQQPQQAFFQLPTLNSDYQNNEHNSIPIEDARDELRRLMNESIDRRLRSDLEVASYLSGGLDSTIVSCLTHKKIDSRLKTFSVSFDSAGFDESNAQQEVADFLGTQHHSLRITSSDIVDNFRDVVRHTESTLFRTAPVPMFLLSRFVRQSNISVVLTGEGADEFFAGYDIFKATLFRQQFDLFPDDAARARYLLELYPYLPHFNEAAALKLVNYFRNHTDPTTPFFSHSQRFSNGRLALQLTGRNETGQQQQSLRTELDQLTGCGFDSLDKLSQAQALEICTLLSGYLLSSQGDRMTSANGLEGRCPFLSLDLIRFAQRLPLKYKLDSQGVEKRILRDTFSNQIPSSIVNRRKQPYRAPDAAPFLSDPDFMKGLVGEELLPGSTVIERRMANRLLAKLQRTDTSGISPREDQAFVFMLSTLFLEKEFCHSQKVPNSKTSVPLKTRIDGRTELRSNRQNRKSA